ncbi:MAG: histidine--tRNA ligase [Patescibacteria group bacterium]|nr:histidine--tRNA ligase [Patescibacteria group bacterium]
MNIKAVKGTRDFYPEQMAFRNWLYGKVKEVSEKFGYQEYDGPEIEYLELYENKTGQEILEGTFTLKDKDNRSLVLRPELTPTFARMVAQKSQELPKQIRWFSFGRAWRYEQPQKGRAREFFQWEINLLGPENPEADAEILAIAVEYFKTLGLTPDEIVIRINDREFMQDQIKIIGISNEQTSPIFQAIDKKEKISPDEFKKLLSSKGLSNEQIEKLNNLLSEKDYSKSPWLTKMFESLKQYKEALDYVEFDPTIVRGIDYYTRTVFEAWDRKKKFNRAIFGGGRFDNLTSQVGGERIPGVGMAPGDIPTQTVLEEYGKMPVLTPNVPTVLMTVFNSSLYPKSLEITNRLRVENINVEIWLDLETKMEKQLKYADQKGIPFVLIIGPDEAKNNTVTIKNLKTREQKTIDIEKLPDEFKK